MKIFASKKKKHDYCCLMLEINLQKADWNLFTTEMIYPNHLYDNRKKEYGIEPIPHITLLYGLHEGTDLKELKRHMPPLNLFKITLTHIGKFKSEDFDVLKFDIDSKKCHEVNGVLSDNFEFTNDYDEYIPHMTIAYMKPGYADNYCSCKPFNIQVQAKNYWYNDTENDTRFKI